MKKNIKHIKFNKQTIPLIISLISFIIWSLMVITSLVKPLDTAIEALIIEIRNEQLTKIITNLTNLGSAYCLIAISVLLLFLIKNKKTNLFIIINLISAFLSNQIIKLIIRRPRPSSIFLTNATGYSYPSGHTMVSFAFYTYLLYLLCKHTRNKSLKIFLIITISILIILIAFSRVYLGVHYLSDTIGGLLFGITYILTFINIIKSEDKK